MRGNSCIVVVGGEEGKKVREQGIIARIDQGKQGREGSEGCQVVVGGKG